MKTRGNTVLITGGATGIGFALAGSFVQAGNTVIICGRRKDKLQEAKKKLPPIHIHTCDLSKDKERQALFIWTKENFKGMNILINNAGVQAMIDLKKGDQKPANSKNEIETNLVAPIRLSALFIPWLTKRKEAAIMNVSSGLAFVPIAAMPVYCATKAALHSFTVSLRHQLKDTSIKVFELVPPMVDTELDQGAAEEGDSEYRGIPPSEVAQAALSAMAADEYEILVGEAKTLAQRARKNPERAFQNINRW